MNFIDKTYIQTFIEMRSVLRLKYTLSFEAEQFLYELDNFIEHSKETVDHQKANLLLKKSFNIKEINQTKVYGIPENIFNHNEQIFLILITFTFTLIYMKFIPDIHLVCSYTMFTCIFLTLLLTVITLIIPVIGRVIRVYNRLILSIMFLIFILTAVYISVY